MFCLCFDVFCFVMMENKLNWIWIVGYFGNKFLVAISCPYFLQFLVIWIYMLLILYSQTSQTNQEQNKNWLIIFYLLTIFYIWSPCFVSLQPKPTKGKMRIHCLENCDKALQFLKEKRVHLENMGSHDIVDGNHRLTLGLIWTIILRFQVRETLGKHLL